MALHKVGRSLLVVGGTASTIAVTFTADTSFQANDILAFGMGINTTTNITSSGWSSGGAISSPFTGFQTSQTRVWRRIVTAAEAGSTSISSTFTLASGTTSLFAYPGIAIRNGDGSKAFTVQSLALTQQTGVPDDVSPDTATISASPSTLGFAIVYSFFATKTPNPATAGTTLYTNTFTDSNITGGDVGDQVNITSGTLRSVRTIWDQNLVSQVFPAHSDRTTYDNGADLTTGHPFSIQRMAYSLSIVYQDVPYDDSIWPSPEHDQAEEVFRLPVPPAQASDVLSTVATIDHDLLIGVEEDQHHAKTHPLDDEDMHTGGYVYKSGAFPTITDADVLAIGIDAVADGQLAVTYDTQSHQTIVWTRINGTWAGAEVT